MVNLLYTDEGRNLLKGYQLILYIAMLGKGTHIDIRARRATNWT